MQKPLNKGDCCSGTRCSVVKATEMSCRESASGLSGLRKCNVTATIWAVASPRRFFFYCLWGDRKLQERKAEERQTGQKHQEWIDLRPSGAEVQPSITSQQRRVLSFQAALVNKTLILLLQLLLRAKKTNFYVLPALSSLSNPATMDAPI